MSSSKVGLTCEELSNMQPANPPAPLLTGGQIINIILSWMYGDDACEMLNPPPSVISNPGVNLCPLAREEGVVIVSV